MLCLQLPLSPEGLIHRLPGKNQKIRFLGILDEENMDAEW